VRPKRRVCHERRMGSGLTEDLMGAIAGGFMDAVAPVGDAITGLTGTGLLAVHDAITAATYAQFGAASVFFLVGCCRNYRRRRRIKW
jgi:hypothetical protein